MKNIKILLCFSLIIASLTGCNKSTPNPTENEDLTTETTTEITSILDDNINYTEITTLAEDLTIGESISDEEVALITEAMELKEVSKMNVQIRYNIGFDLLTAINKMRLERDSTEFIDVLTRIYRWIYEEHTFVTDNFALDEEDNIIYASNTKNADNEMYITAENFYENFKTAKSIFTDTKQNSISASSGITTAGMSIGIPKDAKDLIGICDIFITPDVISAQYQAEDEIVEFVPNDATIQNDYTTYINNMTADDLNLILDSLNSKLENEIFTNGLTRVSSLTDSVLVNTYEFDKVDVKRYYNYYYQEALKAFDAAQGSLAKPIGLQEFGYNMFENENTDTESDKLAKTNESRD